LHNALVSPEQALKALRQALQAGPLDVDSVRQAAAFAEVQGQAEEARRLQDRAWELDPHGGEYLAHDQIGCRRTSDYIARL
jgi:Tfp pilus assembly protein PilF